MKQNLYLMAVLLWTIPGCSNNGEEADAYGNFEAVEVIVSAEVQGRILRFEPREGESLDRGELVAVIDSTGLYLKKEQLRSAMVSLRSKIRTVDAQVRASQVQLANLNRERERIARLHQGGAATSKQLDDINGQVSLLEAQIETSASQKSTLSAEMGTLEVQIRQVDDQMERCNVKSPVKGTLLTRFKEEGEIAAPGQPLLKMANLDTLILRAYLSGNQLGLVKLGEQVTVGFDMPGGVESVVGTVEWISTQAEFTPKIIQTREERVSLVYAIKVQVKNDGRLKIGMPGEVRFN